MEGFFFYQKKRSLKKYRNLVRAHREGALLFDPTSNVVVEVNAVFLHLLKYDSTREGRARLVRREMSQTILPEAQGNGENSIELLERMEREVYRSKVACVQTVFGFLSAEGVICELQIWLTFVWVKSSRKANRGLLGLVVARELSDGPAAEHAQPVPRAPAVGLLQSSPSPDYSPLVPARPAQPAPERPEVVVDPDKLDTGGARNESAEIQPSSLMAQVAAHSDPHTQNTQTRTHTQPPTANPSTQPEAKGVVDDKLPRNEHLASITLNTESLFQLGAVKDSPSQLVVVALHPEDVAAAREAPDGGAHPPQAAVHAPAAAGPVVVPVVAPVAAPMVAPVAAPVVAPVAAPVVAPVADPVVAPLAAPVPENPVQDPGEPRPSLAIESLPVAEPLPQQPVAEPQPQLEKGVPSTQQGVAPQLQGVAISVSDELSSSSSEEASA